MKRAAIKTLYGEFNFGNKLQNYAVVRNLEKRNLETVTLQYYKNARGFTGRIITKVKQLVKLLLSLLHIGKRWNYRNYARDKDRTKIFRSFSQLYLNISEPINRFNVDQSFIDGFDYLVIGSDQVWNEKNFTYREDLEFFLGTNDQPKVIGLAGSFGISEISDKYQNTYKMGFDKMSSISVREVSGASIVERLTNRKPEVLVDPVMTLTEEEWLEVCKKPAWIVPDAYILCYFLGEKNDYLAEIGKYATKNNLKIIDVMERSSDHYLTGPSEFIYLLKNAEYVCTDSFHACVFSLIFNTPFRVFNRVDKFKDMSTRLVTLLEIFDCSYATSPNMCKEAFNWESINNTIVMKKQEFLEYLEKSV
jgi:hypothetical protein